jgi:pSer/pThr/pTyr-binding forkhead associated (FHA) protein
MILIRILSGKKAGDAFAARRFPVRIGRAATADLQVEEPGVWDQHLRLDLDPAEGFVLSTEPDALARVNGEPVQQAFLRNGDAIEIGSLQLQFWLSETRLAGLRLREALTWGLLLLVCLVQAALLFWLLSA